MLALGFCGWLSEIAVPGRVQNVLVRGCRSSGVWEFSPAPSVEAGELSVYTQAAQVAGSSGFIRVVRAETAENRWLR